jgi:hypothetical protein
MKRMPPSFGFAETNESKIKPMMKVKFHGATLFVLLNICHGVGTAAPSDAQATNVAAAGLTQSQRAVVAVKQEGTEPIVVEPKYGGDLVPAPRGAVIIFDGQDASGWMRIPSAKDTNQSTQFSSQPSCGVKKSRLTPSVSEERRAFTPN